MTLVVVGPIRREIERRIDELKTETISEIESLIGREISYSSISPSVLRYLSINDLTIHGLAGEPADLVSVQRLRIYYRPLQLIRGNLSEAFSEIRIENTELSIDTRRDTDLVALWSDFAGSREAGGATSMIPDDLTLSGRNIELKLASDLGIVRVDDLFFTSSAVDDVISVRSRGDVQMLLTSVDLPVSELEGEIIADGTIDLNLDSALFDVTIPNLETDIANLRQQVFQVSYGGSVVEARKVRDRNPVDLYLRFEPEPMQLYARILSDGYRLSELVDLQGAYAEYNPVIDTPVRGQASATITPAGITYSGSILTRAVGLPVPDGDLTVQFSGDTERVSVDLLEYSSELGDVEFDGIVQFQPFRPDGRVTLRNVVYGGIAPLSVSGVVRSRGDVIEVDANRFTYAGVTLADLSGVLSLGEFPVAEATVLIDGTETRRLELATEHEADGTIRQFTVDARSVFPTELVRLQRAVVPDLELPDIAFLPESLMVDTRVSGDLTSGLDLEIPLLYAVDTVEPENHVSLALRYSGDTIRISDLEASYGGYDGRGDFVAELDGSGKIVFQSDVVVEDIPYEFTGTFNPDESLVISGLHDVDARFYFGERDELMFRASGNVPVPVAEGVESRLRFDGEGYFLSEDDWAVEVSDLTAAGIPYLTVAGSDVRLSGDFSPDGGRFERFEYRDAFSSLSGTGSVEWELAQRAGKMELVLTDQLGEETYAGSASYDGENLSVSAVFTRLPLLRAGIEAIRGSVSGSVELAGPPGDIETRLSATLNEGRFNGDLVEFTGVVTADSSSIEVSDTSGRYLRTRFEDVAGLLSLENGSAEFGATIVQPGESGDTPVGVSLVGSFPQTASSFADLVETDFSARAVVRGIPVRNELPEDWQFAVERKDGLIELAGGPEDAVVATLNEFGEFTVALKDPVPLSFGAVGTIEEGDIEADLTNVRADIDKLWRIVDSEGFTFVSGVAEGSVRIVGPLNDPDFYGTLSAANVTATVDVVADLLGPARTFLVFNEKVLTVREAVTPAGPGRARVSAAFTLNRWLPEEYRIWIDTVEGEAIRVVNDFGDVEIDGLAAGSLTLTGGPQRLEIAGDLTGSAMYITLSEVEDSETGDDDEGDLIVDVNVTTGRGVQFLWPTDAFPILRGFADAGESARITHRRSTGSFTVDGAVNIQGGEVFYFDRSFYIKQGRMVFAEDQDEFDPLLSVDAEIREVGPEGPIRIYLVSDERPLSEFTPRWRSDPPLPEAEIIALLGGNVFLTDTGQPIDLSRAVLLTSDLVSQFGIIRGFETTVRDALQVDLFSIRTQLFQNLVQGVLEQGDYPLDSDVPSLGKYLNNTTLFLGKYLGTDLFLELLVQLRETDPLAAPDRTLAGITVESELSLEWQTPFFLLEWSFFPRDPTSLFLTDNTISFAWEYSY